MRARTIIAGIVLTTMCFGTELSAETPNVSFGFGPDGVSFNLNTYPYYYYEGMYPPPPPPRHHHHHYRRGFVPVYGMPMSPHQYKKAVKKYYKEQKKRAKYYRKHHKHHHHDDDWDD